LVNYLTGNKPVFSQRVSDQARACGTVEEFVNKAGENKTKNRHEQTVF